MATRDSLLASWLPGTSVQAYVPYNAHTRHDLPNLQQGTRYLMDLLQSYVEYSSIAPR
jgi:hypothetical protein